MLCSISRHRCVAAPSGHMWSHQNVLALSEAHGDLCVPTADVHELGVDVGHTLGQKQDGIFVLLLPDPAEQKCSVFSVCITNNVKDFFFFNKASARMFYHHLTLCKHQDRNRKRLSSCLRRAAERMWGWYLGTDSCWSRWRDSHPRCRPVWRTHQQWACFPLQWD